MRKRNKLKIAFNRVKTEVVTVGLCFACASLVAVMVSPSFNKAAENKADNNIYHEVGDTRIQLALPVTEFCASDDCVNLIKSVEGFRPFEYLDASGNPTIGYGHLIKDDEKFGWMISPAYAEDLLREDIKYFEDIVREEVIVPITQQHFDALVSFTYNIGEGNFRDSDLLDYLNQGYYDKAGEEFDRWIYSDNKKLNGLIKRRDTEQGLFDTGTLLLKFSNNAELDDEHPTILTENVILFNS